MWLTISLSSHKWYQVTPCGSGALHNNVKLDDDVRNLSGGDCVAPNCKDVIGLNWMNVCYASMC